MNIDQGLFQFDLTDYHAILGVSLEADAKQIRKRYLKIARKLHPDSLRSEPEQNRRIANEWLSKFVNPAYETLTQDKAITEHLIVLRLRGQQLSRQSDVALESETAKGLLSSNNAAPLYTNSLKQLADEQYESLDRILEVTGQISELNLAYLVSTAGDAGGAKPTASSASSSATSDQPAAAAPASKPAAPPPPPSPRQQREAIISSYINRAEEFARKKEYSRAILEMRDAVKSHPTNAQCHSQLAAYYLQAGQPKMARIHVKRALEIAPDNDLAKTLNPKVNEGAAKKTSQSSSKSGSKGSQAKSKGGLFGLFGGKQK